MATSALFGKVGEFSPEREVFNAYVERIEMFFAANGIVEMAGDDHEEENEKTRDRQRAIFLTEIGPDVYSTLSNLVAPRKPKDLSFKELTECLEKHYNPRPLEIAESFHFNTRCQKQGESVIDFIVSLKKLSIHCNYGQFLDRALRDRFVCGLNNLKIQNKLLNTEDLTFERACMIAKSMEMAEKNSQEFHPGVSMTVNEKGTINQVKVKTGKANPKEQLANNQCFRCGGKHNSNSCKFKNARCFKCQKNGHIASVCRERGEESKNSLSKGNIHNVENSEEYDELGIFSVETSPKMNHKYKVNMSINGRMCEMEVDTAADRTIMSKSTYLNKFSSVPLVPSSAMLKTYTGEPLRVCGEMKCEVMYKSQKYILTLLVADHTGKPTLLGRDWLSNIKFDWEDIFQVINSKPCVGMDELDSLLAKHSNLFEDSYDGLVGLEAHITIKDGAKPVFFKPRKVPYALKEAVEKELDKLEKNGVIKKIEKSEWASPIVVVPKADDSVRLCGDYKLTINQSVEDEPYPLPTTQDLYTALSGSKVFSKLDLTHAYAQLSVDQESQEYLTINTHKGLYAYTKLPYGVKSAPKLFQAKMDMILQGVEKCVCKQDDILIGGVDSQENLRILSEVLERLGRYNVHLKLSKCEFLKPDVVYLGLRISEAGLQPVEEKLEAVKNAPAPRDVGELRSFLGMIQYYHSFLPNLASILAPLHDLLKKGKEWVWTKECQEAYNACKEGLTSDSVLVHYDVTRELRLACDASSYGLGAVISHVMDDGRERPIAYASRTLTSSEKNYAQIEREALSLIYGVKKFHQYLYGRKFTLVTDHKPLLAILGPKSSIPTLAAARMQRWALVLSAYDYEIVFKRSEDHANCDALSRLPHKTSEVACESPIYSVSSFDTDFPILAKDVARETQHDPTLSKVLHFVMTGWPEECDETLRPYHNRRLELSCEQHCILWGSRVVIPPSLRPKMLRELHWEHPGICGMKAIARTCVWWPKMDEEIEGVVKTCTACQSTRSTPPTAPLIPWKWPTKPFQRIHVDFCQKDSDFFLVVVDSHSKWIEVKHMTSTTCEKTIDELRLIFAAHGLPEELVSDNGPQFVSHMFSEFMMKNGIKHTLVPPYHPPSNGAAERSVRVLKEALVKQVIEGTKGRSIKHRLANFLLRYRTTPHTTTGVSPSELMVKRKLRTRLSLVKPNLELAVQHKQSKQIVHKDPKVHSDRVFQKKDKVRVRNTRPKSPVDKWISGTVIKVCGPRTYVVNTGYKNRYVHADHMISAHDDAPSTVDEGEAMMPDSFEQPESHDNLPQESLELSPIPKEAAAVDLSAPSSISSEVSASPYSLRRSQRVRKPIDRLDL